MIGAWPLDRKETTMKHYCVQCGQAIESDAGSTWGTCPACGHISLLPVAAPGAGNPPDRRGPDPKIRSTGRDWAIGLISVVCLVLLLLLFLGPNHRARQWVFGRLGSSLKAVNRASPNAGGSDGNLTAARPSSDPAAAKLKEKWVTAFSDARLDFLKTKDQESAEFAGKILAALDQPDGLSPVALAADAGMVKARVRELIRRNTLASAASLNRALVRVLSQPAADGEPPNPNPKTGGTAGPGGLVLYLPFDQPDEKGVTRDASGAGNDGRVQGATWVPDGRFGGAYHFSLTNLDDRIVIPNSDLLNPDHLTVSVWIKTADRNGFGNCILDKGWRQGYCLCLGGAPPG